MGKYYYLLLFFVILLSCKKESKDEHIDTFPAEVRDNVRAFLQAGSDRGHKLDIRKIKHIYLTNNSPDIESIACYNHKDNSIYIDTTQYYWKTNSEDILFHELGHGLLMRDHKNGLMPNSDPSSIMHSYKKAYFKNYAGYKRDYYLDELFKLDTAYPSWSN